MRTLERRREDTEEEQDTEGAGTCHTKKVPTCVRVLSEQYELI